MTADFLPGCRVDQTWAVSDNKNPVDQALDLFVYAPLGFALEARELLPQFIERGRDQLSGQVTMARMMGRFAVQQGQVEAGKRLGPIQKQAATALADLGLADKPDAGRTRPAPSRPLRTAAAKEATTTNGQSADLLDDKDLAVPDYDGLAASQVIPRLVGLSAAELEDVRAYEAAKRGRKTILNKIAQLQAS